MMSNIEVPRSRPWRPWVVTTAFLLSAIGCGGGGAASGPITEATVTGTVTVNGQPATTGEVNFDAATAKRPNEVARSAPIGQDGTYKIQAVVGPNIVRLSGPIVDQYKGLAYETRDLDVKDGSNTFNIDLEWTAIDMGDPAEKSSEDQ